MKSNQTLNSKLNIDEPVKAIKVIDFQTSSSFSFVINRHHSCWLLAYLPAIALKAAAECDTDLTCILFSHNSLYLFWHTSGLKVSTNERTNWIRCFRWGRQCWGASGQFLKQFQRITHICMDFVWNLTRMAHQIHFYCNFIFTNLNQICWIKSFCLW